ncbi:hypothetical protein PR003_g5616 [Phytophthora rubi]|uniref:Uncharacterized protein n=1 Tax=Phytophthora rubi TaxID=129364 RepID=A0A6A4FRW7_9STRA|nr:hypothetical protein PR003_g5616 [Phytophthora rubi]
MSVAMVLSIVIPVVVSVLVVALLFKFVPVLHEAFSSLRTHREHEKTRERIDLEVGGVLMSPEPYHMTWLTPDSKPLAETPKAATYPGLRVIGRPPRSPRVVPHSNGLQSTEARNTSRGTTAALSCRDPYCSAPSHSHKALWPLSVNSSCINVNELVFAST